MNNCGVNDDHNKTCKIKPKKPKLAFTNFKNGSPTHVAVAGNIGAGKTTLTKLLAKHYNWDAHFESVDDNPYLDDFYGLF